MKTQSLDRRLDETCYRLTREIREHPLLCIGIAFGAAWSSERSAAARSDTAQRMACDAASGLSDRAHEAGDRAAKAGHRASRELRSAAHRVADAAGDVDFDKLVSRGRQWLRAGYSVSGAAASAGQIRGSAGVFTLPASSSSSSLVLVLEKRFGSRTRTRTRSELSVVR